MGYTKRVNRSRSRGKGRSRKGGDEELGLGPEKAADAMEQGRSYSPPTISSIISKPISRPKSTSTKSTKFNPKGDEMVGGKRRRGKKSKKHFRKGSASKTRKGRKDFVTHKGDKDYNRRGHRQHKSKKSRKSLFAQLFGI
jgi:hypothetical protein